MADPPPAEAAAHPLPVGESPLLMAVSPGPPLAGEPHLAGESLQPAIADQPQPISPVLPASSLTGVPFSALQSGIPKSGPVGGSSDHPQPSEILGRPPLAGLDVNGGSAGELPPVAEVIFSSKAIFKKHSSARPSMASSHRNLKKRKTAASKTQTFQPPPTEDMLQQKPIESVLEKPRESVLDDRAFLPSVAGTPIVVHPLQTVAAVDASLGDGEDYVYSDFEEEEDDFDLEAYHIDEKKRAELRSLMDIYGVYDEEQLRLAIRRGRKQQKYPASPAGISLLSSESAPTSPSGIPSRFIPPSHEDFQPCDEDPSAPKIRDSNGKFLSSSPTCHITPHPPITVAHEVPLSISMQNQSTHISHNDEVNVPTNPANSHAITNPLHATLVPHATLVHPHATPNPMHPRPHPCNPDSHASSSPMHKPTHPTHSTYPNLPSRPTTHSGCEQVQLDAPSPDSGHMELGPVPPPASNGDSNPCSLPSPHPPQVDQAQSLKFFSNNPLATGDLNDFPPLPKGATVPENGGNGDTVMVSAEEGDSRPNGDPRLVTSAPPVEQARNPAPAPAPRPPTSFAERVKNSAPPTAPVDTILVDQRYRRRFVAQNRKP